MNNQNIKKFKDNICLGFNNPKNKKLNLTHNKEILKKIF
jgi:hypothetical protein